MPAPVTRPYGPLCPPIKWSKSKVAYPTPFSVCPLLKPNKVKTNVDMQSGNLQQIPAMYGWIKGNNSQGGPS